MLIIKPNMLEVEKLKGEQRVAVRVFRDRTIQSIVNGGGGKFKVKWGDE